MNCHECIYRRTIPGDCHISCEHPIVKSIDNLINLYASMVAPNLNPAASLLQIEMNPHGIRNGWCCWPVNFDPIWISNCKGFQSEKVKNEQKEPNQNLSENSTTN